MTEISPIHDETSIADQFEYVAARFGDHLALKTDNQTQTYGQLNQAANRIAHALLSARGAKHETVALLFGYDWQMVAAILGILKAGKMYVAIDPAYPRTRQSYILDDSQAGLILTDSANLSLARELDHGNGTILNVNDIGDDLSEENPDLRIPDDTLAAIFYTSGSTGQPKGLVRSQRCILQRGKLARSHYHLSHTDRVSQLFSFSFGASTSDLFGAILNGATLCLCDVHKQTPREIVDWLIREEITIFRPPIALFRQILDELTGENRFPKLRIISLSGAALFERDVERSRTFFPPTCILDHRFATSESGVATSFIIDQDTEINQRVVPVGYPIGEKEVLILDETGNPVGPGITGEIAIRSCYLAPGYWRNPNLTDEKFLPDPADGNRRTYLTGDLGRLRPDGCLEHLGRKDFMVKIRGFRIEIAEIEAVLAGFENVKAAVVTTDESSNAEKRLIAYVVLDEGALANTSNLREKLGQTLPEYMIPSAFIFLDELPITATGKIDRKALPAPDRLRPDLTIPFVAPVNPDEELLVQIWSKVLDVTNIGINDNFFDLGGTSLLAAKLFNQIEHALGKKLPLASLFSAPTIATQVELLHKEGWDSYFSPLVAVQPHGSKPPLFCMAALGGNVLTYRDLSIHLGNDQPVYALQSRGLDGVTIPQNQVKEIAAAFIQAMRVVQPEGPYSLCGSSFGGTVAFEVACQLHQMEQPVNFVGMFDTFAPGGQKYLPGRTRVRKYFDRLNQQVDLHISNLRMADWQGKLKYLQVKGYRLWRRYRNLVVRTLRELREPLPTEIKAIQEANLRATRTYIPTNYPGYVVLFRASKQPIGVQPNPTLGWEKYVTGKLEIQTVTGHHGSMVYEPQVRNLVPIFKQCLEEAQNRYRGNK
jgi:amino acid adenylation domain-containing protein